MAINRVRKDHKAHEPRRNWGVVFLGIYHSQASHFALDYHLNLDLYTPVETFALEPKTL